MDLRQVLPVPGLQKASEAHVGYSAEGTVEGEKRVWKRRDFFDFRSLRPYR